MSLSYVPDSEPVKRSSGKVSFLIFIRGRRFRFSGTMENLIAELRSLCPGGKLMELTGDAGGERAA